MGIATVEWRVGVDSQSGERAVSDIQVENGNFARIHNDILMALSATRLNGMEWSALMFIFRQTYGWGKKEDTISTSQFADAMGVKRHHVWSALQKLEERRIIHVVDNGPNRAKTYGFNKYIDSWDTESMRRTVTPQRNSSDEGVTPQRNSTVTPQGNKTVTPQRNDKRYKDRSKIEDPPKAPVLAKQPHAKFRETIMALNGELPAKDRVPLVNPIANYLGVADLIDADDEAPIFLEIHKAAIVIHRMGVTLEHLRSWWDKWKADYRSSGATIDQFKKFCSERLAAEKEGDNGQSNQRHGKHGGRNQGTRSKATRERSTQDGPDYNALSGWTGN